MSREPHEDALGCRAIGQMADERTDPQRETDVTGAATWSTSNAKTANIVDGRGHARTTVTRGADGAFRFVPLLTDEYRLRATKPGYRAVERPVNVPDAAPLTLVLLFEPKQP